MINLLDKDKAGKFYTDLQELYNLDLVFDEKIMRLRIILESIYIDITSAEPQSFGNIFQRICFIKEKYDIDDSLQRDINGLRLFANKLIHGQTGEEKDKDLKLKKSFVTLCKAVYEFSGVEIIPEFRLLADEVINIKLAEKPKKEKLNIGYLSVVVLSISKVKFSSTNKKYYTVYCQDSDNTDNKLNINIYEPLSENVKTMYKFCSLDIFSIHKIPDKENLYTTAPDTLIIVNGDYLIDVTTIAECFFISTKCAGLGILKKFMTQIPSPAILAGKIINEILDNNLTDNDKAASDITNRVLKDFIWTALQLSEADLAGINQKVNSQLKNLQYITSYLKKYDYYIEPFFISPYFGIQGRLDVLFKNKENNEINILELKSGNPPTHDLWINHRMQVVGYNLLLASVYGSGRKGMSAIMYSAAGDNCLRNCSNNSYVNQDFLLIRNQLVYMEHLLSEGDFSEFENLRNTDVQKFPDFSSIVFKDFFRAYDTANEVVRKYFRYFTKFIFKEIKTLKTGADSYNDFPEYGFSGLWNTPLPQKENNSGLLTGLELKSFDKETGLFEFIIRSGNNVHNFREGDIGILYPENGGNISPIKNELFKCTIESCTNKTIVISLRNKQINTDKLAANEGWVLEHDIMEAGYNYQLQSIFEFLSGNKYKLLFGMKKPAVTDYQYHSGNLNENQNLIVKQALSADDYYILQGPPGTGKTSKILMNITSSMLDDEKRFGDFAILSFTNRAVNEIAQNLIKNNICFIRLGDDGSGSEYLLNKIVEENNFEEIRNRISSNRIIISTVHSFINKRKEISGIKKVRTVIIDEASQLTEPMLIGILSEAERFILIGDHKQLPAVVSQSEKFCIVNDEDLNEIGIYDLRISLFERLFEICRKNNWTESYGTLEYHFRMHNEIAELVNRNYDNKLKPALSSQTCAENVFASLHSNIGEFLSKSRTIFIPTKQLSDEGAGSEEAGHILNILKEFEKSGIEISNDLIGIVTPWRKQITRLNKTLNKLSFFDKIQIDTIERFQGSEKDIIFFSLCVYNVHQLKNFQSLTYDKSTDRKLNVALSRAKHNLIILGNEHILEKSPFYKNVLDDIRKNNGFL